MSSDSEYSDLYWKLCVDFLSVRLTLLWSSRVLDCSTATGTLKMSQARWLSLKAASTSRHSIDERGRLATLLAIVSLSNAVFAVALLLSSFVIVSLSCFVSSMLFEVLNGV